MGLRGMARRSLLKGEAEAGEVGEVAARCRLTGFQSPWAGLFPGDGPGKRRGGEVPPEEGPGEAPLGRSGEERGPEEWLGAVVGSEAEE